jgi:hypothetical protein
MSTGGIKFFTYTQVSEAKVWNIFHGFGHYPAVDAKVYDDNGDLQKAFPLSVTHIDENNVQVTWSSNRKGYVSLASTVV